MSVHESNSIHELKNPHEPTVVTFASGSESATAVVESVSPAFGGTVVVLDRTPFHPVDHTWPDQPGDAGELSGPAGTVLIHEAVMVAVSDDGTLAVGEEIPVKRGAEGWTWQVGHLVSEAPTWLAPGVTVSLTVDGARRAGLSRGHTACHLASLALDAAVADLWRKEIATDPLGNPDFEGRANQSSRIGLDGSVDEYRLGKSLRRAGFDSEGLATSLAERAERVNAQLSSWVASGAVSRIVTDGPTIIDRRRWECELPEGAVAFPCGGTHVDALSEFASISVALDLSDPQLLVMKTSVTPAG